VINLGVSFDDAHVQLLPQSPSDGLGDER
jgi:hypothetical protein